MRTRTFALAVLAAGLGLASGLAQPPKPGFLPVASSAGKYKVLFPGPVKTDVEDVKTPAGVVKLTLDSVEVGGVTFVVTETEVTVPSLARPPMFAMVVAEDAALRSGFEMLPLVIDPSIVDEPDRRLV